MKLAVIALSCIHALSVKISLQSSAVSAKGYILSTPVVYTPVTYISPVYTTAERVYPVYDSVYYYGGVSVPTTNYVTFYRKETNQVETENKKEQKNDANKIKTEIENLKKQIWNDPNFSTSKIRSDNSAYDAQWLEAQLKITRVLELEDTLNAHQNFKSVSKEKNTLEKAEEKKAETKTSENKVETKVEDKKVEAKAEEKKVESKIESTVEEKKVESKTEEKASQNKLEIISEPLKKETPKIEFK